MDEESSAEERWLPSWTVLTRFGNHMRAGTAPVLFNLTIRHELEHFLRIATAMSAVLCI